MAEGAVMIALWLLVRAWRGWNRHVCYNTGTAEECKATHPHDPPKMYREFLGRRYY